MEAMRIILHYISLLLLVVSFPSYGKEKVFSDFEHKKYIPIPEFYFADAQNNLTSLSNFKGKVLLVNFWATWCVPCVKEMPALSRLAKEFEGSEIIILPIALDKKKSVEDIKAFYKKHKIENLPIYIDYQGSTFSTAQLRSLPTTILVDQKGYEMARVLGVLDWDSESTKEYLLGKIEF